MALAVPTLRPGPADGHCFSNPVRSWRLRALVTQGWLEQGLETGQAVAWGGWDHSLGASRSLPLPPSISTLDALTSGSLPDPSTPRLA